MDIIWFILYILLISFILSFLFFLNIYKNKKIANSLKLIYFEGNFFDKNLKKIPSKLVYHWYKRLLKKEAYEKRKLENEMQMERLKKKLATK